MIHVKDLFRLQGIRRLRLVAGQAGLDGTVRAAVLFEYDAERIALADFYRGDLVVTTLAYAREDAALVSRSLTALMAQGVAGLMVKTGYYDALPQDVLDQADQMGIPVFLFDETYIEEAILEVTELIRGRHPFSGYEKDLDDLMRGSLSGDQARERARRIDPVGGPARIVALYAGEGAQPLADRLFHALEAGNARLTRMVFMSWRWYLLALVHAAEDADEADALDALLAGVGMTEGEYVLGVSEPFDSPEGMGCALSEAVYAVRAARVQGLPRLSADALGIYAYVLPLADDPFVCARCRRQMERLASYDRQNHTSLVQTVTEYVLHDLDIGAAAKVLYQHPNTVRYRLAKVRRMLGADAESGFDLTLSLMVHLTRILESGQ